MKTATATDPDDQPLAIVRVSDIDKNVSQVAILLKVTEQCGGYLVQSTSFNDSVDIDPEAKAQALKTFELAHYRLREIIDEQARWSLASSANERESSDLLKATMGLTNAKKVNVEAYNRPCIYLRPRIRRINETQWCVWIGDEIPRGHDLHGLGGSPAEAMQAFDKAYGELQKFIPQQPADMPVPPAPKPRRKKKP